MKIIDAHLHFSKIESFKRTACEIPHVDYSSAGLMNEYEECGIAAGIAMGLSEKSLGGFPDFESENPMLLDLEDEIPDSIYHCPGINPVILDSSNKNRELDRLERALKNPRVIGIKIYAGYYPYHVYDRVYQEVYDLAEKYSLPVVIHSGDTYSERGLLKYSHPLNVDELAVARRNINFVIAHMGDPWVMDTAEIIRKNYNVYADISGLIVGDRTIVETYRSRKDYVDHIKRGLVYADVYNKILFGSDWPLVQIKPYIEFIKSIIPGEFHEDVFYNNAFRIFKGLEQ